MVTVSGACSGIGMMSHAAQMLGAEVIWECEIEVFPVAVLKKRFPGVPVYPDIREIDPSVESPDIFVAGFPCQDISAAGRGEGLSGSRSSLWFEVLRVITLLRPKMVLIENVRNLLSRGMDVVVQGLLDIGYMVEWDVIPAAAVGACHLRERVWIVARLPEVVRGPVYGEPMIVKRGPRKGERVTFDLDGKLPRAGRADDSEMVALEPIAPRKTKRKDGWSYWVGVNLWDAMLASPDLWPTPDTGERGPHGSHVLDGKHLTGTKAQVSLAAAAAVERGDRREPESRLLWPSSSSSRDYKDTGDLNVVPDKGLLPRRVFHVEQGTAMLPTPVKGDGDGSRQPTEGTSLTGRRPDGSKAPVSLQTYVRALEDGTALLPTPDAYGNGNDPVNHMQKKTDKCGGPRNTITNLDVIARNNFKQPNGRLWPTTTTTDARNARNESAYRPNGNGQHHAGFKLLDAMVREGEVVIDEDQDGSQTVRGETSRGSGDTGAEVFSAGAFGADSGASGSVGGARRGEQSIWPTPSARLGDSRGAQGKRFLNPDRSVDLDDAVAARGSTGSLSPDWTEWLMAIPLGWTDLSVSNLLLTQCPWNYEPIGVPRVALGVKDRSARLKAIGNSIAWPCAFVVLSRALAVTCLT